jgi:hypothetical protein
VCFLNDKAEVWPVGEIEDRLLRRGHQTLAEVGGHQLGIEDVGVPFDDWEASGEGFLEQLRRSPLVSLDLSRSHNVTAVDAT